MSNQHAVLIQVPAEQPSNPSYPPRAGTWTIDPARSGVSLVSPKLRLGSITARLHSLGIIHLDELPPIGVVQFEQPSGLPVLTIALDPASVETDDALLDARLHGPEVFDVQRHRWWTLRSQSLEVDSEQSSRDWLVLRGHGVLDRHALGIGRPAPRGRLDLSVRARRVGDRIGN